MQDGRKTVWSIPYVFVAFSNNIVNFQESTTILNAHTKKNLKTYRMQLVYIYIYIYIYI